MAKDSEEKSLPIVQVVLLLSSSALEKAKKECIQRKKGTVSSVRPSRSEDVLNKCDMVRTLIVVNIAIIIDWLESYTP